MTLHGGCQCRKVRYAIDFDVAKAQEKVFCHCRMCQLATGSPVTALFTIPQVRSCMFAFPAAEDGADFASSQHTITTQQHAVHHRRLSSLKEV